MVTQLTPLAAAAAAVPDADRGVVWIVEANPPHLSSWDVAAEELTRLSGLAFVPTGIALSGDRNSLIVSGADGSVVVVPADDPYGGPMPLAHTAGALGQAAATIPATGRGYGLLVAEAPPAVLSARLLDGVVRTITALDGVTGVAADAQNTWAAATTAGEGRLVRVLPNATQLLAAGLLPTGHVTRTADGEALLVAHPGAGRVSAYRFADGSVSVHATDGAGIAGSLIEVHQLPDGSVLVVSDEALARADTLADLAPRPRLVAPADPLFVGSWVALQYDLSGTGLDDDDVSFIVDDNPDAAFISHTSFAGLPGSRKVPMLTAGIILGRFSVSMVETATGDVLDTAPFEVTDHWHDPDNGPSRMFAGDNAPQPAGDWGGGPNAPQNLGTTRHSGRWRLGVLLVNTTDGSYPTDAAGLAAARKALMDEVQDGVIFNGKTRSARHYYEELSGWNPGANTGLTIQVHGNQIYGPVNLPEGWGTYFAQKKNSAGVVTDAHWSSLGATVQTIVTRALAQGILTKADLAAIDVLVMVPFSPDAPGMGSNRFVWPHALDAKTVVVGPKATDQETFGYIFAPPDFATQDGRQLHATLSHELGHTLGLPDLYNFPSYTPDITDRLTGGWDLMAGSRNDLPHYTLSNRMRQGWVEASHVKLFNFRGVGHLDQTITLHAVEIGAPPFGRFRGAEIRLADGWNVYLEYRAKQASQIGDTLPNDQRVVITDVTSDSFNSALTRPPIVFVHNDADGDGPRLDKGQDYEDIDPGNQKTLVVTVTRKDADNAVVQIQYNAGGRADPGIRPWPGPPNWQSPDIEVRNDRSKADPGKWANTPWVGHTNEVVAKVRNSGDKLAKGVRVNFYLTPVSSGDGPWELLGSDVRDIPATPPGQPDSVTEFKTSWVPRGEGHSCVIVQIPLYVDPDLAGAYETNIFNNEARSNFTRFISSSSSPSTRAGAEVLLANPFDASAIVLAQVRQTHRFHRVYVDHEWLRVEGREGRPIQVFDEALAGFPEGAAIGRDLLEKELFTDNFVSVQGWAERPFPADCGSPSLTGGATIRVGAGRTVVVRFTEAGIAFATGTVTYSDGSGSPSDGEVLLVVSEIDDEGAIDPFGDRVTATATVSQGRFAQEFQPLRAARGQIVAHYLGGFGAAPADSEPVEVHA
jgi:M6 family metalloprotease-like protein